MSLAALALQIASLHRRVQVVALALPVFTRAFDQLVWDENLHPRGAGGKFIGGAGVAKQREAYHLERALKAFDARAKGLDADTVAQAKAQVKWRGLKGYDAVQQHLGHLRYDARQLGKQQPFAQTQTELAALREYYRRELVRTGRAAISPAAHGRLSREIAVLDQHMLALGMRPDIYQGRPVRTLSQDVKDQVAAGIVADGERTGHVSGVSSKPPR